MSSTLRTRYFLSPTDTNLAGTMDSQSRSFVGPNTIIEQVVSMTIHALFIGALLTLGVACIILLSSRNQRNAKKRMLWGAYIVVLLFLNTGFLTQSLLLFISQFVWNKATAAVFNTTFCGTGIVLVAGLTDGVLVSLLYCMQIHNW